MKRVVCSIDIVDIKQKIDSGRFAIKINTFGSVLLEDTLTCEAIQLMQLPEGYSFHERGEWLPTVMYPNSNLDSRTKSVDGWECSVCGNTTSDKTDWCTCGADMRKYKGYRGNHEKLCKTYY